jgi:TonB family protein
MWKTLAIIIFLSFSAGSAFAQKKKKEEPLLYIYDKKWEPAQPDNADYLVVENKLDDTTYQVMFYNYIGPLMSVETYKSKEKKLMHGFVAFYDAMGRVDSCGYSYEGKKNGNWMYFNDSLTTWRSEKYEKGKLLERKDEEALKAERKERVAKGYVLLPGEKEAKFKSGESDWRNYVGKNLTFPKRAEKLGLSGKIRVRFMIDPEGYTTDIWLDQSVEYSLDAEAIRLIRSSPKWAPAVKDGVNVNAWRIQPVTFARPN